MNHETQSPLKACDASVYVSSSKGAISVEAMHGRHLLNAKKVLLRKWATYRVALEAAAIKITQADGDPGTNASVDLAAIYNDPGALYPVYNTICDELTARSEAWALKEARGEVSEKEATPI